VAVVDGEVKPETRRPKAENRELKIFATKEHKERKEGNLKGYLHANWA
jgi:hypothetical protein